MWTWMGRAALAFAALVLPIGVAAQDAPGRAVTMIVNFPPGGLADLIGRGLAAGMAPGLGVPVVVQNRGGAGGTIGVAALAAAPNDGATIGFVATASLTTLPHMRAVPYRTDALSYVCRTFDVPVYMLVAPNSRFTNAASLVEAARAEPDRLNFATVGPGSLPHLAALDWAGAAGISLTHIPYQGEAAAVVDLLAGRVEVYFGTSSVASIHQLRRLGVAAAARLAESPTTPTLTELGYPVVWSILGGVIAPPGTDPAVRQALERACAQAVEMPEYRALLQRLQVGWAYSDGAEFRRLVLAESVRNRGILAAARVPLE